MPIRAHDYSTERASGTANRDYSWLYGVNGLLNAALQFGNVEVGRGCMDPSRETEECNKCSDGSHGVIALVLIESFYSRLTDENGFFQSSIRVWQASVEISTLMWFTCSKLANFVGFEEKVRHRVRFDLPGICVAV